MRKEPREQSRTCDALLNMHYFTPRQEENLKSLHGNHLVSRLEKSITSEVGRKAGCRAGAKRQLLRKRRLRKRMPADEGD